MLLSSINDDEQSFLLIHSTTAQSGHSIFRQVLARTVGHTILFCLLNPLLQDAEPSFEIHDWSCKVPGYNPDWTDPRSQILSIVKAAPSGLLHVAFDSIDTLLSDIGSVSATYKFLYELFALIKGRPSPARMTLHALRPSALVPLLIQPSFSPSLVYISAHPPIILTHISKEYLIPPPPASPPAKFWSAFIPLSERNHEISSMIFGVGGEGSGSATESVVEILVRRVNGPSKKRGVERALEGWNLVQGCPCDLMKLESLKGISTKTSAEVAADPTQLASFNLSLTASQQKSRAKVPLPYVHEGNPVPKHPASGIFYDPDSADDLDDDDPDEDLDI